MANEAPVPSAAQRRVLDNLIMSKAPDSHITESTQRSTWLTTWKALQRHGWVSADGKLTQAGLDVMDTPGAPATDQESVLTNLQKYGPASHVTLRIRMQTHSMLLTAVLSALQCAGKIEVIDRPKCGVVYGAPGWEKFPRTVWRTSTTA